MRAATAIRHIILPQAFRRSLGGCGNEVVSLMKYSSLAYLVTLVDLTGAGKQIAYRGFRFFETFLIVGLIYFALVAIASSGVRWLERYLEPVTDTPRRAGVAGAARSAPRRERSPRGNGPH